MQPHILVIGPRDCLSHTQTYTGSILVAVNPYQVFDIYGVEIVQQYEGQLIGKLPPYVQSYCSHCILGQELEIFSRRMLSQMLVLILGVNSLLGNKIDNKK